MLGKGCNFDSFHQAWVNLWKLETIPKVRHLLWRICTGYLPVRDLLKHRHKSDDEMCPWCRDGVETIEHAFFKCPTVCDLWIEAHCQNLVNKGSFPDFKDLFELWHEEDKKV